MWTLQNTRLALVLWMVVSGILSVTLWCLAVWWPAPAIPDLQLVHIKSQANKVSSTSPENLDWESVPWSKALRPPPPVLPAAAPEPARPEKVAAGLPSGVRLLGTMLEPGQAWAMLQTSASTLEVCRVNDVLGGSLRGGTVTAIAKEQIEVSYQNRSYVVRLEQRNKTSVKSPPATESRGPPSTP